VNRAFNLRSKIKIILHILNLDLTGGLNGRMIVGVPFDTFATGTGFWQDVRFGDPNLSAFGTGAFVANYFNYHTFYFTVRFTSTQVTLR